VQPFARGPIHTNTAEGYCSIFKRGMKGIYQHCAEKQLHRYLAKFDFLFRTASALASMTPCADKALLVSEAKG
jgi:hypothetical protein